MLPPLTDEEWTAWLTDLEPYYGQDRPLAEAFLRLSRRCADAEAERVSALACVREPYLSHLLGREVPA